MYREQAHSSLPSAIPDNRQHYVFPPVRIATPDIDPALLALSENASLLTSLQPLQRPAHHEYHPTTQPCAPPHAPVGQPSSLTLHDQTASVVNSPTSRAQGQKWKTASDNLKSRKKRVRRAHDVAKAAASQPTSKVCGIGPCQPFASLGESDEPRSTDVVSIKYSTIYMTLD